MNEAVTLSDHGPCAPVAQTGTSARLLSGGLPVRFRSGAQLSIGVLGADNTGHPQPRRTRKSRSGLRRLTWPEHTALVGPREAKNGGPHERPEAREEAGRVVCLG